MSTEQQKSLDNVVEVSEAGFVLTKSGVMFVGSELLGDQLAGLLCAMIERDDLHGLSTLVIRTDNFPVEGDAPIFGMAYADTFSVAINLEHCWHRACVKAHHSDVKLGFMGILWINVLSTLAHELDHLTVASNDRVMYELMRSTEDGNKELETSADAAAEPMLLALAKQFDIEIPTVSGMGWFAAKIMDLFTNDSTKDLEWVIKARKDMEDGIIYAEPENKIEIKSFREFVKIGYDNDGEGWDQPTTAVNLIAYLDNGVVEEFKAEPVEAPVVDAVELEADKPAEAAAEMVAGADGQFVGAGMTTGSDEPEIVMADGVDANGAPTIAMVAKVAAQPIETDSAAQAIAQGDNIVQAIVDAVPANKICPNTLCGKELLAEWNSCPHCKTVVNKEGLAIVQAAIAAGHPAPSEATAADTDVPLPAPVAAQVEAMAAAAATGTPPVQVAPTTYTPHSMEGPAMAGCMEAVWKILYHHMFTKCGWQQNPQTGRFMFTNAAAVLEGVNIQHILTQFGAENFIMEYDTLDADGKYAAEMCQGMIRGRTTSKQGLPSYALYLNIGGQRIKRSFIPQNPEKRNAQNAYTPSAELAGIAGHMIVWVFKDEVPDAAPFSQKCAATIKDNAYEIMS